MDVRVVVPLAEVDRPRPPERAIQFLVGGGEQALDAEARVVAAIDAEQRVPQARQSVDRRRRRGARGHEERDRRETTHAAIVYSRAVPYLTAQLPGTGGLIKAVPEDFVVEELPAYAPSGEGQHLFLTVEKRGITTREMVLRIARELGVDPDDVGV